MSGGATEWEDILIQQGIIKAPKKPEDDQPELVFDISNKFGDESPDELDDLVDDDDEFFTQYKQSMLQKMMDGGRRTGKFGQVNEISRPDFTTEITEASKNHFVLLHLYQPGHPACQLITRALRDLCSEYPAIKFVEIVSTRCIEKYPDQLLPTILVYKDTNVYTQITMATPDKVKKILDVIQQHLDENKTNE